MEEGTRWLEARWPPGRLAPGERCCRVPQAREGQGGVLLPAEGDSLAWRGGLHSGCLCCPVPSPNAPSIAGSSGSDGDWVEVSAGGSHTCGMKTGGALFCWGEFCIFFGGRGCECLVGAVEGSICSVCVRVGVGGCMCLFRVDPPPPLKPPPYYIQKQLGEEACIRGRCMCNGGGAGGKCVRREWGDTM